MNITTTMNFGLCETLPILYLYTLTLIHELRKCV
uniref:Uncharacterized protein n=1 Tax=Anguilla anguilla TaxID=7936 RepID=A0A0E9RC52_ANGAN